jgi:hypothetical protein
MRPMRDEHKPEPRRTVDADGVRIEGRRSASGLAAWGGALLLLTAIGWLFVELTGDEQRAPRRAAGAAPVRSSARPSLAGAPAASSEPEQQEEVYLDQIDPGSAERTGIHLFPRPGTKPIAGGILVPSDYELPPGYMRHYQTTDDGERVGPILVFHPDHQPVDESGRPIPLPPDRVVPPELAPPGMPVVMLEPPPVRRDFDEAEKSRSSGADGDAREPR